MEQPEEIESHLRFIEDGLMLIRNGKVEWFGQWEEGKHLIPEGIRVRDYSGKMIVPGFMILTSIIHKVKWLEPMVSSCWNG